MRQGDGLRRAWSESGREARLTALRVEVFGDQPVRPRVKVPDRSLDGRDHLRRASRDRGENDIEDRIGHHDIEDPIGICGSN